jgi:hypothetical protein
MQLANIIKKNELGLFGTQKGPICAIQQAALKLSQLGLKAAEMYVK